MKSLPGIARRLLAGTLLALCAVAALPQTPAMYMVEIVVFRSNSEVGALPDVNPAPALADDDVGATLVPTSKLNAAAAKLGARNSGFKVLAHVAWTQAATAWGTAWKSRPGVSTTQLGLGAGMTGRIFLQRENLLHLGVDLTVEEGGRRYHISEIRDKVKVGEIQYFDQPAVGVLAIVSPATTEAPPRPL